MNVLLNFRFQCFCFSTVLSLTVFLLLRTISFQPRTVPPMVYPDTEFVQKKEAVANLPSYFLSLFPAQKSYLIDLEPSLGVKERQALRMENIQWYCNSDYHRHDFRTEEITVNQYSIFLKQNASECRVAKTGTSARGKIYFPLNHKDTSRYMHPIYDKAQKKAQAQNFRQVLQSQILFSYMFVRDPFERAVSCYFDKIMAGGLLKNKSMTLEDFVRHLSQEKIRNEHLVSQLALCNPCLTRFSFLGRTETHNSDMYYIINEATDFHKYLNFQGKQEKVNNATRDSQKFETLTLETVTHFIWTFRHDYLAFGYNPYHAIKKVMNYNKRQMNECC